MHSQTRLEEQAQMVVAMMKTAIMMVMEMATVMAEMAAVTDKMDQTS
jgi:hypothetical protein